MKARVHNIVITTQFDEEIEAKDLATLMIGIIQSEQFPRGLARIDVRPFSEEEVDELQSAQEPLKNSLN